MKQKLKLLLLPILVLSLTACGTSEKENIKTPVKKDNLKAAIEKTNKVQNYHMDYKFDMAVKSEGMEMEVPMSMAFDVDPKSKVNKLELTMEILGIKVSTTSLMDMKNNIMYTKDPEDENKWTKEKLEQNLNSDKIGKYSKATKIDSTEEEDHYQITMAPQEFQTKLSALESNEMTLSKDVIADIYIDKKTNYVTKIIVDLKDSVKPENDGTEYTKLTLSMTLSNFDNVTVDPIDQKIIDNAVESED